MYIGNGRSRIRITPLGGVGGEEFTGNNSCLYQMPDGNIVVDCGLNTTVFLEERTNWDKGLKVIPPAYVGNLDALLNDGTIWGFVTHAHLDHFGAIGELLRRGIRPIMSRTTRNFVERYAENLEIREALEKRPWQIVKEREYPKFRLFNGELLPLSKESSPADNGGGRIHIIPTNHSVLGSYGLSFWTNGTKIVHLSDFKFNSMRDDTAWFEKVLSGIAGQTGVSCLLLDILNIEMPGFTLPEEVVVQNLRQIIQQAPGRVFVSIIASNLQRLGAIMEVAEQEGKGYSLVGWSMNDSYQMLQQRSRSRYSSNPRYEESDVIIVSGTQGETNSKLRRLLDGSTKDRIELTPRDTVVLSSRCIPGNEALVKPLVEDLLEQCGKVVLNLDEIETLGLEPEPGRLEELRVHVSGHGQQGDIMRTIEILRPRILVPIHAPERKTEILRELLGREFPDIEIRPLRNGETLEV